MTILKQSYILLCMTFILLTFCTSGYTQNSGKIKIGDIEASTFESYFDSLNSQIYVRLEPKNFRFIKTTIFDNEMSGLFFGLKKQELDTFNSIGDGGKELIKTAEERFPNVAFFGKKDLDQKELYQRILTQLEQQLGKFEEANLVGEAAVLMEMFGSNMIQDHKEKIIKDESFDYVVSIALALGQTTVEIRRLNKIPDF